VPYEFRSDEFTLELRFARVDQQAVLTSQAYANRLSRLRFGPMSKAIANLDSRKSFDQSKQSVRNCSTTLFRCEHYL